MQRGEVDVDIKSLKAAIAQVVGGRRSDYSTLSKDEIMQTCTVLGFKMSPYLAIEAHMVSCGGF